MPNTSTDRNLLFGLIAMQSDLIDMRQFVDACTLWGSRKESSLADILVESRWLLPEDRQHVDYLLERRIQKAGGDVRKTLETIPDELRSALKNLSDQDDRDSLQATQIDQRITTAFEIAPKYQYDARISRRGLHSTGGIGHVWLAYDRLLDREIALKELKLDQSRSAINRERFFREAQITAQLTHPGTVPVYDYVDEGDRSYYTMKFVNGRTLTTVIAEYHDWRRARGKSGVSSRLVPLLNQFVSICNTIAFAHSRGVIHRDLKSENVLVGDFGEVVVLDWGLAKRLEEVETPLETLPGDSATTVSSSKRNPRNSSQTMQGDKLGTPAYMSPEQARGEVNQIDQRTDVYGLAAILYEILVGDPPFLGGSIIEVLESVIHDLPKPPSDCVDGVPPELERICLKGLSKKRDDRQHSAEELGDEIHHWIAERAERKRTEQERERFFNLSLDLLTILDTAGRLTQTNPAWETVLGWTGEELRDMRFWDLLEPADHEHAKGNHARILSGESLTQMEYRCVCRDGSHRWILWNAKLIPGESSIYLVGRDITERKQAEQTFQNLLESAPDAMVVINDSGRIVLVNAQLESLLGYSRDQLLGQPIEMLVPKQYSAGHPQKVAQFIACPQVRPMGTGLELEAVRADGTVFAAEISLSPVETEQGLLVSCAIRNIEKSKQEHRKLQAILESAPDAMVIVDVDRRIQIVNSQVENLFGYGREELLGQPIEILIPERYRADHPDKFQAFVQAPQMRPMASGLELWGRTKAGTEIAVEVSLSPVETDEGLLVSAAIRKAKVSAPLTR